MTATLDQHMNKMARMAMLNLLERHAEALTEVMQAIGVHLHESDVAALDDHLAAMQRLTKSLGASGL